MRGLVLGPFFPGTWICRQCSNLYFTGACSDLSHDLASRRPDIRAMARAVEFAINELTHQGHVMNVDILSYYDTVYDLETIVVFLIAAEQERELRLGGT